MSQSFTKLFSSITESTVWFESSNTRIVWITMLALADQHGEIHASIPGLAQRAVVSVEDTELALQKFLSPDKYSRTKEHDGRRIEEIPGGWRLLNYQKYRELGSREARRDQQRQWDRENRARPRQGRLDDPTEHDGIRHESDIVRQNPTYPTQAEAEAEAEASKKKPHTKPGSDLFDEPAAVTIPVISGPGRHDIPHEFRVTERLVAQLAPAYPAVDVKTELLRMKNWLDANPSNRKTLRGVMRFITNWLSRAQDRAPRIAAAAPPPAPARSGAGISPPQPREHPLKAGLAHIGMLLERGVIEKVEHDRQRAELHQRYGKTNGG